MIGMKKMTFITAAAMALLAAGCSVFTGRTAGDTVVMPLGDEVTVTDGSLVYALPMTVFEIDITAEKRVEVPGPYAAYAAEMIGLDRVITSEKETWSLTDIQLNTVEELDPSKFYIIQGTTLMQTNMLALRKSGLVMDINPDVYRNSAYSGLQEEDGYNGLLFPDRKSVV